MKNFSFSVFNIFFALAIGLLIVLIVIPFNLMNLDQAERIAKWKTKYEQLEYDFSLVNLHEGSIAQLQNESGKIYSEKDLINKIKPYFQIQELAPKEKKKYRYKKMNGRKIRNDYQFKFDNLFLSQDGMILGIKKNINEIKNEKQPLFFMLVDINGKAKPNRIGQDIFFINIYSAAVNALGHGRAYAKLKSNCSPIGSGLYCSEYYMLGGRF